jgi:phospholipid-transporting ATPase
MRTRGSGHWYVWQDDWNSTVLSVIVFFSYFLLYTTMIPISLVVSLEFVKLFQAYFIEQDKELFVVSRGW